MADHTRDGGDLLFVPIESGHLCYGKRFMIAPSAHLRSLGRCIRSGSLFVTQANGDLHVADIEAHTVRTIETLDTRVQLFDGTVAVTDGYVSRSKAIQN